MLVKAIIKRNPAGEIVTEVLDRQQHLCTSVYTITSSIGKQLKDEDIGPDCDPQQETLAETGSK